MGEHAVHQHASIDGDGEKDARISAAGAHRVGQRTGPKYHAFSGYEVRRGNCQRDPKLFEGLHLEKIIEKADHAQVSGKPIARQRPAGKIAKADAGGNGFQFRRGDAAAIGGSDQCTDAGSGDVSDWNVFFFRNLLVAQSHDWIDAAGAPRGDPDGQQSDYTQ